MNHRVPGRSVAMRLFALMALPVLLVAIYLLVIRPSQLHWGATAEETARSMPGDDLVSSPSFCATRGVTIHGRPEDVWPWLAQMGYGRAGFYGYDLIENVGSRTGIRSAVSILPELQHPKTGEVFPISAIASLVFDSMQPGSYLIWRGDPTPSNGSFLWALYPVDESHTRLISRIRLRYHWTDRRLLLDLIHRIRRPCCGTQDIARHKRPCGRTPNAATCRGGYGDHGVGSRPGGVGNGGCAHIPLASMVACLVPWTGSGALVAVRPVCTRSDVDWRCAGLWHRRRDAPAIANRFRVCFRGLNWLRGSPQKC